MATMSKDAVLGMVHEHFPSHLHSRQKAILTDHWIRGEQYQLGADGEILPDAEHWEKYAGDVFQPRERDDEHKDLESRASTPWGGLVVTSLAQTAYIEGIRRAGQNENCKQWDTMRANRWDSKQNEIHRAAIGLSTAYGVVVPGSNPLTGAKMQKMLARSPKRMSAFYQDDDDEWSIFSIDATEVFERHDVFGRIKTGWFVEVYDEFVTHRISCTGDGADLKDWTYIDFYVHGFPVPPVVRCVNRLDLDGKATGEIEPILPMLRRIDQGTFDRLIVQRFGAWKIRYIAGMAKPTDAMQANLQAMELRIQDLLISTDNQTKFGTLDATDPKAFIEANDADLRMLAAITQTPPHHLLGLSSNLQAESLAAAESGLQRKSFDFKLNAGQFHESMARLLALGDGDTETAAAEDLKVRWRDTESRSLVQAADALGKLAVQLKIPVEMLWEKVPGWDDSDTERAKKLIESGTVEQLLAELNQQMEQENAAAAAELAQQTAPNQTGGDSGSKD